MNKHATEFFLKNQNELEKMFDNKTPMVMIFVDFPSGSYNYSNGQDTPRRWEHFLC